MTPFYRLNRVVLLFIAALALSTTVITAPRPHLLPTDLVVGGACGTTIQACINAAANGDTITIPAGIYPESLALNKAVSLMGSGAATTIVQVPQGTYHPALAVNGGGAPLIANLTLTGGNAGAGSGGGLVLAWGAAPTISNVVVTGNTAGSGGGGVYVSTLASPVLINVVITGNQAVTPSGFGGSGLLLSSSAGPVQLINSLVADNPDLSGHGQVVVLGGTLTILESTIASANSGSSAGVTTLGGTALITDTIVASQTIGLNALSGHLAEDNNLFFGNGLNQSGAISGGADDLDGDPAFVDSAAGNYHLLDTSAAIDRGRPVGVASDGDGDVRPFGPGFDLGFDEHQRPAITLTTPSANQILSGTALLISGLTNPVDQVPQVDISTDDGAAWTTAVGTTTWGFTWTVPAEDNLPHLIRARVTDRTHNTTWSAPLTVTVDRVPPQVNLTDPVVGQFMTTSAYTLTGTAADGSGLAQIEVSVDNGATFSTTRPLLAGVWSWRWSIPAENGVSHLLRVRATDRAGNVNTLPAPLAVFVDNVPPWLTFSNLPISGQTTITAASFTVAGLSVGALTTTLDLGQGPLEVAVVNDVFSQTFTLLTGTYTLHGLAVDEAGNRTTITSTLMVSPERPAAYSIFLPIVLSNFDAAQDGYEPDDNPAQARPLPTDGTVQRRNFYPDGDVDWVRLEVGPGTYHMATTVADNLYPDTVMAVYAANGLTPLAFNDDCLDFTRASCLTYTASVSATVYLKLWPYDTSSVGTDSGYGLSVVRQ